MCKAAHAIAWNMHALRLFLASLNYCSKSQWLYCNRMFLIYFYMQISTWRKYLCHDKIDQMHNQECHAILPRWGSNVKISLEYSCKLLDYEEHCAIYWNPTIQWRTMAFITFNRTNQVQIIYVCEVGLISLMWCGKHSLLLSEVRSTIELVQIWKNSIVTTNNQVRVRKIIIGLMNEVLEVWLQRLRII